MEVNYRDLKILDKLERQSFIESLDKSIDITKLLHNIYQLKPEYTW